MQAEDHQVRVGEQPNVAVVVDERAPAHIRQAQEVTAEERRIVRDAGQRQHRRRQVDLGREAIDDVSLVLPVGCENHGGDPVARDRNLLGTIDPRAVVAHDEHDGAVEQTRRPGA